MSANDILWAEREFCSRAGIDHAAIFGDRTNSFIAARLAVREGAKLIAAHEEAPVDPVVEAIEVACCRIYRPGTTWPGTVVVRDAIMAEFAARGIELAKAGEA